MTAARLPRRCAGYIHDWTGDTDDWFNNCGGDGVNGGCMWTVPFAHDYIWATGGDVKVGHDVKRGADFGIKPD